MIQIILHVLRWERGGGVMCYTIYWHCQLWWHFKFMFPWVTAPLLSTHSIMFPAPQGITQIPRVSIGSCASAVQQLHWKMKGHQALTDYFKNPMSSMYFCNHRCYCIWRYRHSTDPLQRNCMGLPERSLSHVITGLEPKSASFLQLMIILQCRYPLWTLLTKQ